MLKKMQKLSLCVMVMLMFWISGCKEEQVSPKPSIIPETRTEENFLASGETPELIEIELFGETATVQDRGEYYLFQGDIRLDKHDVNTHGKMEGTGINGRRWPSNRVYYRFEPGFPYKQLVLDAISHLQANTWLRFTESSVATDYIEFVYDSQSAYSNWIGKKGGRQVIGIPSWAVMGNVVHEFCHALGVFHEQSRTDRATSIIVNYNNIAPDWRSQYYTWADRGESGFNYGNFDFNSIMLYSSDDSYNGGWSMTDLSGNPFWGQRTALSNTDISLLRYMYPRIDVTISGPTSILTGMKPGKVFYTYTVNFGSFPSSSCSWSVKYGTNGPEQSVPGTTSSVMLTTRINNAIKDGVNEVNFVQVHCPATNQYAWLSVTVKDGYELSYTAGPTPD